MKIKIALTSFVLALLFSGFSSVLFPASVHAAPPSGGGCGETWVHEYTIETNPFIPNTPGFAAWRTMYGENHVIESSYLIATVGDFDESCVVEAPTSTPTPTANIILVPSAIDTGGSSLLSWSSSNATSCTGTNFSTGGASGGTVTVSPAGTTLYSVTCTDGSQTATASATLTVNPPPAPTVTLIANPNRIQTGESSTLTWTSTNAVSCIGSGFDTAGNVSGSVSTGSLAETTNYSITCSGESSSTTSTSGGSAATSGTWQFSYSDISDFFCPTGQSKVSSLNLAYSGVAWCPPNPSGQSCNGIGDQNVCKINKANNSCQIETDVYQCVGASSGSASVTTTTTAYPALTASAYATVTVDDQMACVPNVGEACTSAPNSCNQTASGVIQCGGTCSASVSSLNCPGGPGDPGGPGGPGGPGTPGTPGGPNNPGVTSLSALLTASPTSVVYGAPSMLSWTSAHAVSCSGGNFSTGGAKSGTLAVTPVTTTLYSLTCTDGSGNNAYSTATVTVIAPTLSISGSPNLVRSGDSSTITWSVSGHVDACTVSGPGLSSSAVSGSKSVPITSESIFTLSCTAGTLHSSVSTSVKILPAFREQ
ncbi:MAG: hypothetical protein V4449_04175 [Patescibacteria group bacterium]